ncbi:MAG: TlpA disulfide reductase family protein [Planctomycetota bacterium]
MKFVLNQAADCRQNRRRYRLAFGWLSCALLILGCGPSATEPAAAPDDGETPSIESESSEMAMPDGSGTKPTESGSDSRMEVPPGDLELPDSSFDPSEDPEIKSPGSELQLPDSPVGSSAADTSVQFASWEAIETQARQSGKIAVIDLWSLTCEPCLKEFPGLVRLHEELGDQVHCVGVDVDFDGRKSRPPETYGPRVASFLSSVGALDSSGNGFPNYISQTPSDDVLSAVKVASIPAVLVFDREGNLVKQFADAGDTIGFTYEKDVIPLVKKLAG